MRSEDTGALSDSLTLDIPSADVQINPKTCPQCTAGGEEAEVSANTMSGGLLIMVIFIVILLILAVTVGLVIRIFRRTQLLSSSQSLSSVRVSSPSLSTEKNKSIISFDTFVARNKISVPEIVSTKANFYA